MGFLSDPLRTFGPAQSLLQTSRMFQKGADAIV